MHAFLVAIDTIFSLPSICVQDLEKYKNIIFSPWGHKNIQNDVAQPARTLKPLKCLFSAKMTKMSLVNPRLTKSQNPLKIAPFLVLHQTRAFRDFWQL